MYYPNYLQNAPTLSKKDDWRRHACIQVVVRFVDGRLQKFYSRDIDHYENPRLYQNIGHWVQHWRKLIQFEEPSGWKGRVDEAAIFYSFDGNKGDKIAQWSKIKGGWQPLS